MAMQKKSANVGKLGMTVVWSFSSEQKRSMTANDSLFFTEVVY